ncbi:UNVERIFIED_ORG: putative porin [Paraburkholderia sediminicola]|nr:putative porin [Paraburkholderia sediminicola]
MNRSRFRRACLCALAVAGTTPGSGAHAQSSVTLYGLIDVEVVHRTGTAGGAYTAMGEGALQGSRWGLLGTENLGSGWNAIFDLENGFALFNGKLDQQGQAFGRQAWVGLSSTQGAGTHKFTAGRQYNVPFNTLYLFDPRGWANDVVMSWPALLIGARTDNAVQYAFTSPRFSATAQYTFGGQPGTTSAGQEIGLGATYTGDVWSVGAALQRSRDANLREMRFAGMGANASIGAMKLFVLYQVSLRDADFTPGASGTTAPLANTSMISNAGNPNMRRDGVADVGLQYRFTPAFVCTAGFMHDWVSGAQAGRGSDNTVYLVSDYSLSKRTDVYAQTDFSRLTGSEISDPYAPSGAQAGARSSVSVGVGIRTRF